YPVMLAIDPLSIVASPTYVACSGAETWDILHASHNPKTKAEPAQIGNLQNNTDVVTITIGGDDVGFASVLAQCAYEQVPHHQMDGYGCSKEKEVYAPVAARIAALAGGPTAYTPQPDSKLIYSIQ